ncbi:fatty acid desaturase [Streptomyces sp. R44]|uniref:Fatty acid desaturase n=1 Tax=Streptomyces sp. R44 TaxID=3238633 RepID=A0AB39TE45_9ACTN
MNTGDITAEALFERSRVTPSDERVFLLKVALALLVTGLGGFLALTGTWWSASIGVLLLTAMYTHMVELQHQCLHHSAFSRSAPHRPVGFLLGLPLLSAYSHYRVQHLQHHKYLGTPDDSEFFGFDTRAPLTWGSLLRAACSPGRLIGVGRDMAAGCRGTWTYTTGQIGERARRHVIAEYRAFAVFVAAALVLACWGHGTTVLLLWVAPLLLSLPVHFLLELPEHVLCDSDSTDVLRNTRTISGSWFSRWFTNGNNFHVEHHAAMTVPINRLPARHPVARELAVHSDTSYAAFYLRVLRVIREGSRGEAA